MATKIPKDLEENICKLYNDGYGTIEISKNLHIHRATVQKTLIRNNISLRKTSPYIKKYNVHYFDEYTAENCYWAGFILADGCIRSDRDAVEIHLQECDKEHLLKFAKAINFTGKLIYDKYSKAYSISIAGKWFPEALKRNFGITSKKSLKSKFPKQVPVKYWNHLIRGIFDGDGSITTNNSKYSTIPMINIIGTVNLIKHLRKTFYDWGVKLKSKNNVAPIISCKDSKGIGYIAYSGFNAYKILKKLYQSSSDEIQLARKYNRFTEFLNQYE